MKFNLSKYFKSNKPLRPLIVAEISANHCGKKSLFIKTIKSAAKNGADLIKIQTYEPGDITINKNFKAKKFDNRKIWKLYSTAQTPYAWHKEAFDISKKLDIEIFSSPFSERAVDFLTKFKVKLFKLSSFEINDFKLIKKIALTKKPVIISTGMAKLKEIKDCVKLINKYHNKIILLHCVSGYPTSEDQANLKRILTLKKNFKKNNIGLSDHTNDINTSIASIPYNPVIIEKHFILSEKLNSLDKNFSITPSKLRELSKKSRNIFTALGDGKFKIQKSEKKSLNFRRSIFTIKNLKKGEKFSKKNISTFRPKIGLSAKHFFKILGKKSNRKLKPFSPVFSSYLE